MLKDILSRAELKESSELPETRSAPDEDFQTDMEIEDLLKSSRISIKIVGCGGAGSNTINCIYEEGITGAELIAANTDAQHLLITKANKKILLGRRKTRGLGAGAQPDVGEESAKECEEDLKKLFESTNIVFITCGLGGGTGTGSAPIIAKIAKSSGALVCAFVTLPFHGEGTQRMENALWGLERLNDSADTVIIIPNDKLLELVPRLPLKMAFKVSDQILMRAIKGLTEIITKPGLVNVDFSDINVIMKNGGYGMIALGESSDSDDRAAEAVNEAIHSPLLDADISSANGVLINVTGSHDMTLAEAEKIAELIQQNVSPTAKIIWGCSIDPTMNQNIRIMLILTGVKYKSVLKFETPSYIPRIE